MAAEPKSGKLFKLSVGLFGAKWSEKWAHWDGRVLKCFPIASEQQSSSSWVGGTRQGNCAFNLADCSFALANEKLSRKHVFHLLPNDKATKPGTFACVSEKDLAEWKTALTASSGALPEKEATSIVAEKVRRAAEAFSSLDPRRTDKLEISKLRVLLREGADAELALIQQQLDPTQQGKISRDRLLRWLTNYYNAHHVMERVQNEKAVRAKRDAGVGADPVLSSSTVVDRPWSGNQLHPRDGQPECSSISRFDWNAEYSELLSDPSTADPFLRGLRVAALVNRFREAAEHLVRKIIEELPLVVEAKSVQPLPIADKDGFLATDGLAASSWVDGGLTRYHHDGMLVYLLMEQDCGSTVAASRSESPSPLDATQTQLAFISILKHQIQAAQALQHAIQEAQRDQQADRTEIEVNRSAAVLSTVESSRSIEDSITNDLKSAFERLGLLSECLDQCPGPKATSSTGAFTLPAFFPRGAGCSISLDDEAPAVVLHNLASLFPILNGEVAGSRADIPEAMLGRLRREFVCQHGPYIPLASNALVKTPVVQETAAETRPDPRPAQDVGLLQLALQSACEHLVEVVIPGFMADLEEMPLKLVHSQELVEALHASGINVRLLGRCYTMATRPDVRRWILSEMLARAAKVELGISLRAIVHECIVSSNFSNLPMTNHSADDGDASSNNGVDSSRATEIDNARLALVQQSATRVVIEFVNLMLGAASHPDSKSFWENRILPRVRDKFALHGDHPSLTFESIVSGESVHFPQLFLAAQAQTNIAFCDHMEYNFWSPLPVADQDLVSIAPMYKASVKTTAECDEILAATDEFIACDQLEAALDNVKFHLSIVNSTEVGGGCQQVTLCHLLTCAAELSWRLNRHDDAREYATFVIEVAPKNHAVVARAHAVAMKLDGVFRDLASVERHFMEAVSATTWHVGPSSSALTDIFMTMVDVCSSVGEFERAEAVLADCADLTRQCLGKRSLPYADVRRRQAMLMYHRWQSICSPVQDQVLGLLQDAIAIYERHLSALTDVGDGAQLKLFAASCYFIAAELTSSPVGSGASSVHDAYSMAHKALALRKDVLSSSHSDVLASNLQLASLAGRAGESFRAVEYYRQALATLEAETTSEVDGEGDASHRVDRIRDVSRAMLQLFLGMLSKEQHDTVDKIKRRFAGLLSSLREPKHPVEDQEAASPESNAVSVVVRNLFLQDPVEYVSWLIDRAEQEILASPRSPVSYGRGSGTQHSLASDVLVDRLAIQTPAGDVTFGAQFAVVLFLAENAAEHADDTTV